MIKYSPWLNLIMPTEDESCEVWKLLGSICYDFKLPFVEHDNSSDLDTLTS